MVHGRDAMLTEITSSIPFPVRVITVPPMSGPYCGLTDISEKMNNSSHGLGYEYSMSFPELLKEYFT